VHRHDPADSHLRALAAAVGAPIDVYAEAGHLFRLAVAAVPSCIGVSLVLHAPGPALTVSAMGPGPHPQPVLASLAVRLPRPQPASAVAELVLYAATPRAFHAVVPSLLVLLDRSHRWVSVDGHLAGPDLVAERAEAARRVAQSDVDRAVGVLLDRGMLPAEGYDELRRLASVHQISVLLAARAVLAEAGGSADAS
jgi:hypothetical protein